MRTILLLVDASLAIYLFGLAMWLALSGDVHGSLLALIAGGVFTPRSGGRQ